MIEPCVYCEKDIEIDPEENDFVFCSQKCYNDNYFDFSEKMMVDTEERSNE